MSKKENKKVSFWFATGGAGFCLSRPLVKRMAPMVENGEFVATGETIRLPDDVTVGFIIGEYLKSEYFIMIQLRNNQGL